MMTKQYWSGWHTATCRRLPLPALSLFQLEEKADGSSQHPLTLGSQRGPLLSQPSRWRRPHLAPRPTGTQYLFSGEAKQRGWNAAAAGGGPEGRGFDLSWHLFLLWKLEPTPPKHSLPRKHLSSWALSPSPSPLPLASD